MKPRIILGDSIGVMRRMPEASIDAIVTDPPYGLGFMGKAWDDLPPGEEWARECLRVLKPGGHLLAFGGTRTWHRLAVAVEDAGFEIRDSIAWMYGSGFPKSLDVSKAIDKRPGVGHQAAFVTHLVERRTAAGLTRADVSEHVVGTRSGACWNWEHHQFPEARHWPALRDLLGLDDETWGPVIAEAERARVGSKPGSLLAVAPGEGRERPPVDLDITAPATPEAAKWQGWGTALKPAHEPIIVARKPLAGTVAATVLAHGTGALNIDACRIGDEVRVNPPGSTNPRVAMGDGWRADAQPREAVGRWPANVVLDEDQAAALDAQSGVTKSSDRPRRNTAEAHNRTSSMGKSAGDWTTQGHADQGGASRFFYCAKAPKNERPFYFRQSCACKEAKPCEEISRPRDTGESRSETGASWSTSTSGSSITGEQSRPDTTSTTGTATSSTTTSATSSSSPNLSTSAFTPGASSAMGFGGSPAESAASSSQSVPTTGTSAGRGGRSTDDAAPATSSKWSETSVCGSCGARAKRESHATVKPLSLMRWLVRLVTPAGGTVLDPFAGSGTTIEAAMLEGFSVIGIEREAEYLPLIGARIARVAA